MRMASKGEQDLDRQVQDEIIDALGQHGEPVNHTKLQELVDASRKKFRSALEELVEKRRVRRYKDGRCTMYVLLGSDEEEAEKRLCDAEKMLEKISGEFSKYPPELRQEIDLAVKHLLRLDLDARARTYKEFDGIADGDYDEIRKKISKQIMIKSGHDLLCDGRLVVRGSVWTAVREALGRGGGLRGEISAEFEKAAKVIAKSAGNSKRRREAVSKRKTIVEIECAIVWLAELMEHDVRQAVDEAKSAVKMRDGQSFDASVPDDNVRSSDYGMAECAFLDCRKEIGGIRDRIEPHLKPGDSEMNSKIDAVLAALNEASRFMFQRYAESMAGTESAVYKAARKMEVGVAYCAVFWAARSGRIKEPFSAQEARKAAGDCVQGLLHEHAQRRAKWFKKEGKGYRITGNSLSGAVRELWLDPAAR